MAPERETTLDVRVWDVDRREGKRGATFRVRWIVAGRERQKTFVRRAQADSYRAELLIAIRRAEPFDVATGQPASTVREPIVEMSWFELACDYVDMKWPRQAVRFPR